MVETTITKQVDRVGKACPGRKADGSQCQAPVGESGWCFWHDPDQDQARREAGRRGGSRRAISLPVVRELTADEVRAVMASLLEALLSGALDHETCRAAVYLISVERKVAERESMRLKVAELEQMVKDLQKGERTWG